MPKRLNDSQGSVDVTPAMLAAAHSLLWDEQVSPWEDRDDVLTRIYRAMHLAAPSDPDSESECTNEPAKVPEK